MQEGTLLLLEQVLGEWIGPIVQLKLKGHLGGVQPRQEHLVELQAFDAVHRRQPQGWITGVVGLIGIDNAGGETLGFEPSLKLLHGFVGAGRHTGRGQGLLLIAQLAQGCNQEALLFGGICEALNQRGVAVLRVPARDVLADLAGVLESIGLRLKA